jgi:5-methylcytosine-specific restriction protein A
MTRASKVCTVRGCPRFTDGGSLCPAHLSARRAESDAKRGPDRQWYGAPAWRALRAIVLREEPICRLCSKTPSTIVDHIEPRQARPDLALVRGNLRGLCKSCHDRRTGSEHGFTPRDEHDEAAPPPRRWVIA